MRAIHSNNGGDDSNNAELFNYFILKVIAITITIIFLKYPQLQLQLKITFKN